MEQAAGGRTMHAGRGDGDLKKQKKKEKTKKAENECLA
jgi:hypothetical protein